MDESMDFKTWVFASVLCDAVNRHVILSTFEMEANLVKNLVYQPMASANALQVQPTYSGGGSYARSSSPDCFLGWLLEDKFNIH